MCACACVCLCVVRKANSEWNPRRPLLALRWTSLIQKAFITEGAGRTATDVIEFWGPDTGRESNIFTFQNAEIRGLDAAFLSHKQDVPAKNILALCVFHDPDATTVGNKKKQQKNPIARHIWMDAHEHVHWQTRFNFTQFEPQHWCKHGLLFPSNFLRNHYFGLYRGSFRSSLWVKADCVSFALATD